VPAVWKFLTEALEPVYGALPAAEPDLALHNAAQDSIGGDRGSVQATYATSDVPAPSGSWARPSKGDANSAFWMPTDDEVAAFSSDDLKNAIEDAEKLISNLGISGAFRRVEGAA